MFQCVEYLFETFGMLFLYVLSINLVRNIESRSLWRFGGVVFSFLSLKS